MTTSARLGDVVRDFSDRMVEAQQPIRVLDAVKWDDDVRTDFLAHDDRQPAIDRDYYLARPPEFDPASKREEFRTLARDIRTTLGDEPVAGLMVRICEEYEQTVAMIEARGTPHFTELSQSLYGAARETLPGSETSLAAFGDTVAELLARLSGNPSVAEPDRTISGEEAVAILQERLGTAFPGAPVTVDVRLSDGIVADAAAGSDYLKIRAEARFNLHDLRLLEMHEGWVHICTSINGRMQPYCTFLSKGPPSSTVTQEGLAILIEVLAFASYPDRVRKISNRIRTIARAEEGATFLDIFRLLRSEGLSPADSYNTAARTFRGSVPTGGPFTKDLSYSRGFFLVYNYILNAVRMGLTERIPLLFAGKTMLTEMRTLNALRESGLVVPPTYLPPQIENLQALTAWMCYSTLLRSFPVEAVARGYDGML